MDRKLLLHFLQYTAGNPRTVLPRTNDPNYCMQETAASLVFHFTRNTEYIKTAAKLHIGPQKRTKSMYRFLLHRGVINKRMRRLWKNKMPMKVKVFMWLASQNRIQSGELLGVGGEEEVGRETRDVGFVG
jgi:hypothetical protein